MLTQLKCIDGKFLNAITLRSKPKKKGDFEGICPHCKAKNYIYEWILDDCYRCAFVCSNCNTYLFLDPQQIPDRGYGNGKMALDLPTKQEKEEFGFPENNPFKEDNM